MPSDHGWLIECPPTTDPVQNVPPYVLCWLALACRAELALFFFPLFFVNDNWIVVAYSSHSIHPTQPIKIFSSYPKPSNQSSPNPNPDPAPKNGGNCGGGLLFLGGMLFSAVVGVGGNGFFLSLTLRSTAALLRFRSSDLRREGRNGAPPLPLPFPDV